jgi:hypothetical protein
MHIAITNSTNNTFSPSALNSLSIKENNPSKLDPHTHKIPLNICTSSSSPPRKIMREREREREREEDDILV